MSLNPRANYNFFFVEYWSCSRCRRGQRIDSIIECRVARQLATPRSLHLLIYVLRDIKLAIYCSGFVRDGAAFHFYDAVTDSICNYSFVYTQRHMCLLLGYVQHAASD